MKTAMEAETRIPPMATAIPLVTIRCGLGGVLASQGNPFAGEGLLDVFGVLLGVPGALEGDERFLVVAVGGDGGQELNRARTSLGPCRPKSPTTCCWQASLRQRFLQRHCSSGIDVLT